MRLLLLDAALTWLLTSRFLIAAPVCAMGTVDATVPEAADQGSAAVLAIGVSPAVSSTLVSLSPILHVDVARPDAQIPTSLQRFEALEAEASRHPPVVVRQLHTQRAAYVRQTITAIRQARPHAATERARRALDKLSQRRGRYGVSTRATAADGFDTELVDSEVTMSNPLPVFDEIPGSGPMTSALRHVVTELIVQTGPSLLVDPKRGTWRAHVRNAQTILIQVPPEDGIQGKEVQIQIESAVAEPLVEATATTRLLRVPERFQTSIQNWHQLFLRLLGAAGLSSANRLAEGSSTEEPRLPRRNEPAASAAVRRLTRIAKQKIRAMDVQLRSAEAIRERIAAALAAQGADPKLLQLISEQMARLPGIERANEIARQGRGRLPRAGEGAPYQAVSALFAAADVMAQDLGGNATDGHILTAIETMWRGRGADDPLLRLILKKWQADAVQSRKPRQPRAPRSGPSGIELANDFANRGRLSEAPKAAYVAVLRLQQRARDIGARMRAASAVEATIRTMVDAELSRRGVEAPLRREIWARLEQEAVQPPPTEPRASGIERANALGKWPDAREDMTAYTAANRLLNTARSMSDAMDAEGADPQDIRRAIDAVLRARGANDGLVARIHERLGSRTTRRIKRAP